MKLLTSWIERLAALQRMGIDERSHGVVGFGRHSFECSRDPLCLSNVPTVDLGFNRGVAVEPPPETASLQPRIRSAPGPEALKDTCPDDGSRLAGGVRLTPKEPLA